MSASAPGDAGAREWVEEQTARVRPLQVEANRASWKAATTGSDEALARAAEARAALRRLYSDAAAAREVKRLLAAPDVKDAVLRRQLELEALAYAGNQLPEETITELTRMESGLERTFYTHRARFEGEAVANNVLLDVLRVERDGERRRAGWEASKQVGREVAEPLRALVRARNEAARGLGYATYYSMELSLQELDEAALFRLLDRFRADTDEPFAELRGRMDAELAERHGVEAAELRPWHWEDFFAQDAPSIGEVDLDRFFADRDLVPIAASYFESIGLPVGEVLARSDLYEREGKDQHAFCTDLDRSGDVRVLCNLRPNERSMATLLHELGHAAYDRYISRDLPYLLRAPAHTMVTEASAMYMGRLTRDPAWLRSAAGVALGTDDGMDIRRQQRMSMLVSARWMLVMAYFERELYRDPERRDLNSLWWDLVESIQLVRRPEGRDEPDWAAKLHLSLAPVYYHNYLLGELTASQLGARIRAALPDGQSPVGRLEVGRFLREEVYAPGATLRWDALVRRATGEPLSPESFVADFV
jgi:peptidyl-dipeptidase A